jgi:hypothetical protein
MTPASVRRAAMLVALEGAAGIIAAALFVIRGLRGADQHIVNGFGNAAWFGLLGAGVLTAAWALWTGRRWGRGIAIYTQMLLLPVSWYVGVGSHQWPYAILVAALAVGILVLLFSPTTLHWMSDAQDSDSASADSSGPETR